MKPWYRGMLMFYVSVALVALAAIVATSGPTDGISTRTVAAQDMPGVGFAGPN